MDSTRSLIEKLSGDLQNASPTRDWKRTFWLSWVASILFMAVVTAIAAAFLPEYIHLPDDLSRRSFWLESSAWFGFAALSAVVACQSALPGRLQPAVVRIVYGLNIAIAVSLLSRWSPEAIASEVSEEMSLIQGPCGVFILLSGIVASAWMFRVVRQGAPVRLGFAGAWAAASVGAVGGLFMNLVCSHTGPVHIVLWHVIPLILLILPASIFARRSLRW